MGSPFYYLLYFYIILVFAPVTMKPDGWKFSHAHKTAWPKGQLISNCLFGVIISTKKPTEIL